MQKDQKPLTLQTRRLRLREWRAEDLDAFAAINADPLVMKHYPATLTRAESDKLAERIQSHFQEHGYGLWAVEIVDVVAFAGFVGLHHPRYEAHFTPCVEIGWRIAAEHWNQGYATEAARAAMDFGAARFDEIVSFTSTGNMASRRVMEKLGMTYDPKDDFDHPLLSTDHRLCRHVLYRMSQTRWNNLNSGTL